MSGKLQAKLKKSRASQLSLHKELELAKAETVSTSERQAETVRAQLEHMRSQLDAAQAEVAQASDVQVQLEGQLHKAQADNTQVSFSPFVELVCPTFGYHHCLGLHRMSFCLTADLVHSWLKQELAMNHLPLLP